MASWEKFKVHIYTQLLAPLFSWELDHLFISEIVASSPFFLWALPLFPQSSWQSPPFSSELATSSPVYPRGQGELPSLPPRARHELPCFPASLPWAPQFTPELAASSPVYPPIGHELSSLPPPARHELPCFPPSSPQARQDFVSSPLAFCKRVTIL